MECSGPKLVKEVKRYKWRVDGRVDWNEYQSAIECEFMGWEEVKRLESTLKDTEAVWVLRAASTGIGKKKVSNDNKEWWAAGVEEAIFDRKQACKRLRVARRSGVCESVIHQLWEEYKKKRKAVKVVIREEKRRSRKVTLERIRKQGGTSSKLFWADLKGRKKQTSIDRICDRNGEVFEGFGGVG